MDWSAIEGPWWRLRGATWADEPAIAAHGRHPDPLWIGIGPTAPPERAHQVVEEFLKGSAGAFGLVHLAVANESDAIVGMVGAQEHGAETVEIVYGVAPACRGRGLATEILANVTRAARETDSARRYELVIAVDNAALIRVAQKCGYRLVDTRRSFVAATGQTYEDLVYVPSWFKPSGAR
jgi:RimJ/RimL family protein N-acetyltransferase